MARRNRKNHKNAAVRPRTVEQRSDEVEQGDGRESKRSIAVTVAWTMAGLATFCAELIGSVAIVGERAGAAPEFCQVVAYLMFCLAFATGLVTLGLTPIALRFRDSAPPTPVTIALIMIGALPIITFVVLAWNG